MDHGQLSMVADKFQWVFSESLLNACGKDAKFCRRERIITPLRLCQPACRDAGGFSPGLQCLMGHFDHLQSLL